MRLCAKTTELTVTSLFLHDSSSWYPYDDEAIAEALTEAAREHTKPGEAFRVVAPSDNGLGRFTINWMPNFNATPKHFIKRANTREELQQMVGSRPMQVLAALESKEILVGEEE